MTEEQSSAYRYDASVSGRRTSPAKRMLSSAFKQNQAAVPGLTASEYRHSTNTCSLGATASYIMKKQDIKRHLQDYSIYGKRKTTIAHAFASALSVADTYDEKRIDAALRILGQDPNKDLLCVYCDRPAETWDHIMAIVRDGKFSGYGHQIGNLIPCCKDCNSKKGNRDWREFLFTKRPNESTTPDTVNRVEAYIKNNTTQFKELVDDEINADIEKFEQIQGMIFDLMKLGDEQAKIIRDKLRAKTNAPNMGLGVMSAD